MLVTSQAEADLQLVAPLLTSFIVGSKNKNHGHHRSEVIVHCIGANLRKANLLCCFHGCTFISDFEASRIKYLQGTDSWN